MNDARDTQLDYVHCMWAGNDEAGNIGQPRTFGAAEASTDTDDDWEPVSTMEALKFWGAVMLAAMVSIGLAAAVAVYWPVKG